MLFRPVSMKFTHIVEATENISVCRQLAVCSQNVNEICLFYALSIWPAKTD